MTGLPSLLLLPLLLAPDGERAGELVERRLAAMGTELVVAVEAASRAEALAASEAAVRAVEGVEARLSTWTETSELARLCAAPVGEPFPLSDELRADLDLARRVWTLTDGAFDPCVGALVRAWDLRGAGRRPSDEELRAARVEGGFAALELELDAEGRPVARRRRANVVVEEGGFGKGVGLDAALAALAEAGATSARVELGGQVALFGREEVFAVAHPERRAEGVVAVRLDSGSFATSGNSERAVAVDGERLGHLLDPRTGRPAPIFGSVTVFAESAALADALSTGLYVLGPDEALALAAELRGVDALVLELAGAGLRVRATTGLRGLLTLTAAPTIAPPDRASIEWTPPPKPKTAAPAAASDPHR